MLWAFNWMGRTGGPHVVLRSVPLATVTSSPNSSLRAIRPAVVQVVACEHHSLQ